MISIEALLFAAALVGILHMSAPDHWVTLVILGRSARWKDSRLMAVSFVTGAGHVALSIVLGFAAVALGLVFSKIIALYFTDAIGAAMVALGLLFAIRALVSGKNELPEEEKAALEGRPVKAINRSASYFAVLGAALSPDLSILPIFILAVPVGLSLAIYTAVVFTIASITVIVILVYIGSKGMAKAFEKLPPKYNDSIVGFVIAAVGVYVLVTG